MKIRTKVFLGYFIAATTALFFLMQWVKDDVRSRYLEAVEENMVDMVNTLAALTESHIKNGKIEVQELKDLYSDLKKRQFCAKIYNIDKRTVDSQIYITDKNGIVLFDSGNSTNEGEDFSKWNNIKKTLHEKYGARATRLKKDDPKSLVLHVSAPIKKKGEIIGVITVYKPITSLLRFIHIAEARIRRNAIFAFILLMLLGIVTSTWITNPILKLKKYVDTIRDGKKATLPEIGKGELKALAKSFEEMREALEGKKYVENYIQNLTHELKSPLSGIQGALELMAEKNVPPEQREKFINNMQHESKRMRNIVDRMLRLSQLENINTIHAKSAVDIKDLIIEITNSLKTTNPGIIFSISLPESPILIKCDKPLIRDAINNILKNAVEFTPKNGKIEVKTTIDNSEAVITVTDNGAGIPEYALNKVFEKFFSLPRPGKDEKSSGLGLSITKEIIELHKGTITIKSDKTKGTTVTVTLPG
jgi:two-component system sensor histidine kinase CreC